MALKVVSIEPSSVTLLGVASRKEGTLFALDIFKDFVARYNFSGWPSIQEIAATPNKYEFKLGQYDGYQINTFDVYNDGIVVRAPVDTDIIDSFVDDVLTYIADKWGITLERANSVDKMYHSVITFSSEKDVLSPLNAAVSLISGVRDGVKAATGVDFEFASAGITLAADEAAIASMKPATFKIERRAGIEFKFNHYFSAAPLRTRDHVALLEKWEASV